MREDESMREDELVFLALAIWREARGEPLEGKRGVAQVVLNRVAAQKKKWGLTVMQALFKRLQFSSLTHSADKQLTAWPTSGPVWEACLDVARDALWGPVENPVGNANSYHDTSVDPGWPGFICQIGRLKFYKV